LRRLSRAFLQASYKVAQIPSEDVGQVSVILFDEG